MIDWDNYEIYSKKQLRMIVRDVADYVEGRISRIKMGLYSEEHDGSLLEVLEEIEGMIR